MDTYYLVHEQAKAAHMAARSLAVIATPVKNKALQQMAVALEEATDRILVANAKDLDKARANNMKESMLDRLTLTQARIADMAEGLRQVARLEDPIGNIIYGKKLPNGLTVTKVRVPLGVIGIIYEARPNVTADAIGLCIKSGNAVILKGGSEALESNFIVSSILTAAAEANGIPQGAIQFINSSNRQTVTDLIKMKGLVDCVIPRGSAGLIQTVVENATVPVIETGVGVCHTYIDDEADYDMACAIALNAKVTRPSVCNALETLLVHRNVAATFLPKMLAAYKKEGVTIFGDAQVQQIDASVEAAQEKDWETEYGDLRLAVKIVDDLEGALAHIAQYGTQHSECIVTKNYERARIFQQCVDAAAVYVNASTRFTDGFEFGFGAEIGISTQKLHARGPMALPELTSTKYLINGDGQIRI